MIMQFIIYNITSLTSGNLSKHLPWNSYPNSIVKEGAQGDTKPYSNISQQFSFTEKVNPAVFDAILNPPPQAEIYQK